MKRGELKKFRLDAGFTQKEFGEIFGVSGEHIKSLELGRVKPSVQLMFKICNYTGRTPVQIFPDITG